MISNEMQSFLEDLQPRSFKTLNGGKRVEIRVKDVEGIIVHAQSLIDSRKLNLSIVSNGNMASYGAFEVWEGKE